MFQHICRIPIPKEDLAFAKRAITECDLVSAELDRVLGKYRTWDGRDVEVRLCGRPGDTALLAAAVFSPSGELQVFQNTAEYCTCFELKHKGVQFLVCIIPED